MLICQWAGAIRAINISFMEEIIYVPSCRGWERVLLPGGTTSGPK